MLRRVKTGPFLAYPAPESAAAAVLASRQSILIGRGRWFATALGLAAVAVLLRLPFLGTLGPDEGGYAYIASAWARGGHLYGRVWVDRPQGLMLAYRSLLGIAHQAWAIRLGAVVAAVAITLLLVLIGNVLESPKVGLLDRAALRDCRGGASLRGIHVQRRNRSGGAVDSRGCLRRAGLATRRPLVARRGWRTRRLRAVDEAIRL